MRPVGQVCSNASRPCDTSAPAPTEPFFPDKAHGSNIVRLTDTIQTPNTLLQQIRLNGRSNITMWLANWKLRPSDRFPSTAVPAHRCLLQQTRRSAVTFDNRHAFVEHCGANTLRSRSTCSSCSAVAALAQITTLSESDDWSGSPSAIQRADRVPPGGVIAFKFLINTLRVEQSRARSSALLRAPIMPETLIGSDTASAVAA